jgi:hypothetical protein
MEICEASVHGHEILKINNNQYVNRHRKQN